MSTVTPTDNSLGRRNGVSTRAAAVSINAIMRAVASTAGNESPPSVEIELARSFGPTTSSAEAVAPISGSRDISFTVQSVYAKGQALRSEERRVGKESRYRWLQKH